MPAVWAIALTVCAGAAIMVIGPVKQRLADARTALDAAHSVAAQGSELTARKPILEMTQARIDRQIKAVEHAAASSSDPSALMSRINTLAAASSVVVERVSPRAIDPARAPTTAVAPQSLTQMTIHVRGNFEGLTAFIDGLERDNAFASVQGLRVTPMLSHGMNDLTATIDLVHASFAVPSDEQLAAMALTMPGAPQ